jgi:hypothetical protein
MNPLIGLKRTAPRLLSILALLCFGLLPGAQAVVPPPDGGYPNFNTAEGQKALFSLTTGQWNTALGAFTLWKNTDGSFNTAVGTAALLFNIGNQSAGVGIENTAVGAAALLLNTTGSENTAVGVDALLNNTEGDFNTATGAFALSGNSTGERNTATGDSALYGNSTGNLNTANGNAALVTNTSGIRNTATGASALFGNSTGANNTAEGFRALFSNTSGALNTANGEEALLNNTTGNGNTAIGASAFPISTTGSHNIALGAGAGIGVTTANNVICIGTFGENATNSCFIGNIREVTTVNANAIPVLIDSNNQLGTTSSSRRFKKEIKPMDSAILAHNPVTFHYKSDKTNTPQFGLIAEEVAAVNPDLVVRDENGEVYTVRYDAVNAMLLNEFLKEHRKVEEQQATITQLKKDFGATIAQLTARLDEQAAQIQKVSAQVEASKPAPQVVNNP